MTNYNFIRKIEELQRSGTLKELTMRGYIDHKLLRDIDIYLARKKGLTLNQIKSIYNLSIPTIRSIISRF